MFSIRMRYSHTCSILLVKMKGKQETEAETSDNRWSPLEQTPFLLPKWSFTIFVWLLSSELPGLGDPTRSWAPASIALRISETHELPHGDHVSEREVGNKW